MAPFREGSQGVPIRWVATVRLETTKGPRAIPPVVACPAGGYLMATEQIRRPLPLRFSAAAGSMDGPRQASGPLGQQQGAGVGEPQAPFWTSRKAKTCFEHAGGPPATAKGHNRINRWIVPG